MTGSTSDVASVVIVDDDVAFADALGLAISLTPHLDVVGRAHDAEVAYDVVRGTRPDLLISDYRLQDSDSGIECARRLRGDGFTSPIVILTSYLAPQVEREAETIPRLVVLSKRQRVTELITAFGQVLAGTYLPSFETGAWALSSGELEVLEHVNAGRSAAWIAEELQISLHTVRSRLKSLMKKLDASSQVEAVAEATRLGLLVPPS